MTINSTVYNLLPAIPIFADQQHHQFTLSTDLHNKPITNNDKNIIIHRISNNHNDIITDNNIQINQFDSMSSTGSETPSPGAAGLPSLHFTPPIPAGVTTAPPLMQPIIPPTM
ncbi:hypothetical protein IV203_034254 [Nitzschia inconspicua]|uniref:Uncharacterized protein n=1 Tax=Nitzschia inconspicua TaxID=303405 RepID=A0A9K3M5H4_9STRA|nr:hypothetical protein IV203_034254 [Nitzschia inconspicua]